MDVQPLHDLVHRPLPVSQDLDDPTPGRVGDDVEGNYMRHYAYI
jgi:hypothetical protein